MPFSPLSMPMSAGTKFLLNPTQELIDNPPSAAFVATLGHQVVAVIVASREACGGDEVAQTRSEFHVEDFISFERHRPRNQAVLTALALNPIFSGHCRFALKEVMRPFPWALRHLEKLIFQTQPSFPVHLGAVEVGNVLREG